MTSILDGKVEIFTVNKTVFTATGYAKSMSRSDELRKFIEGNEKLIRNTRNLKFRDLNYCQKISERLSVPGECEELLGKKWIQYFMIVEDLSKKGFFFSGSFDCFHLFEGRKRNY